MNATATRGGAKSPKSSPAATPKLLVIDDDPELLQAYRLRLRQFDVELIPACHGTHGLWLASTREPDLIVADVRMPQGSGDYVVQCLKQRSETASIPVIVLTGHREEELTARMLRLGAAKVLYKPIDFRDWLAEVSRHIHLRRRGEQYEG